MKTLSCKDLGAMECDYVAKGETKEEAVEMMMAHAQDMHPDKVEEMSSQMDMDEIEAMMMEKVRDAE